MIKLRDLQLKDLDLYKLCNHPDKEHHKFNGPYFGVITEEELNKDVEKLKKALENNENPSPCRKFIVDEKTDELIGSVNF